MLMLLIAAIPLVILASVIAWQNYRMVAGSALERALTLRAATVARHDAVLEAASSMLRAASLSAPLRTGTPAECSDFLRNALLLQGSRIDNIVLIGAGGARCSAMPPDPALTGWLARTPPNPGTLITDTPVPGPPTGDGAELLLALPLQGGTGRIVASLPIDWLGMHRPQQIGLTPATVSQDCAWLVGSNGQPIALGEAGPKALPQPTEFARLLATAPATLAARSRGGTAYAYASAPLAGDLRVLVATLADQDIAVARAVLARRLVGLGILLAAGLAAVALSAHRTVVTPINRLSQAVQRWRGGQVFDPGPLDGVPAEVRELSESFTQATSTLAVREQQLRTAIAQQELLMQEIHHRVKNNLQIVASLLNLQASRIRLPEARREFQSARDRIRALATLHRHLYAHGDLHTINMRSFLHELCDQLLQAMGERPEHATPRIQLHIEASELQISSDQAVPMALIVTEAVSNAAKYAFPGGRHGHIRVNLTNAGNHAHLTISDDGVGLPPGPIETESGPRDGIGLHLMRGFARQLGSELVLTQQGGTRYEVDILIRRERQDAADPVLA